MTKRSGFKIPIISNLDEKTLNNVKTGVTIVSVATSVGAMGYAIWRSKQKRKIVSGYAKQIEFVLTLPDLESIDNAVRNALRVEKIDEKEYLYLNGLIEKKRRTITQKASSFNYLGSSI